MTPSEVRSMGNPAIIDMLVSATPADEALAWLAAVIADPAKVSGINELSRRFAAKQDGPRSLPRAKSAGTILIDGAKFKHLMWVNRIPMNQAGPMIGKCEGWASVAAYKGRLSYWAADALATELGLHVDALIEAIASPEELERLTA